MPAGLTEMSRFWWQDLTQALTVGADRIHIVSESGARWLTRTSVGLVITGMILYLSAGYHAGFFTLNEIARDYPSWLWQTLTLLGDERVVCALALWFARREPHVFWSLICAVLLAALYARGLKAVLDWPRPPAVLEPGSFQLIGPAHRHASFPSGHSVTAGVFFAVLIYHARWCTGRVLLLLLAVLAGLSRVALGVHWPLDVIAGLAGGFLAAAAGIVVARQCASGVTDAAVHLVWVTLALLPTSALLLTDGGYPEVAGAQKTLGLFTVIVVGIEYALCPWGRFLALRRSG